MRDPIERSDALDAVEKFRRGIFHDQNLTKDNEHDWEAAYCMEKLHSDMCRIPRAMPRIGEQIVSKNTWSGEMHVCSICRKIVPYIDWCQPYCSGCGAFFSNYQNWCAEEKTGDEEEEE